MVNISDYAPLSVNFSDCNFCMTWSILKNLNFYESWSDYKGTPLLTSIKYKTSFSWKNYSKCYNFFQTHPVCGQTWLAAVGLEAGILFFVFLFFVCLFFVFVFVFCFCLFLFFVFVLFLFFFILFLFLFVFEYFEKK